MEREAIDLSRGRDRDDLLATGNRLEQAVDKHAFGARLRVHRADVGNQFRSVPRSILLVRVSRRFLFLIAAALLAEQPGKQTIKLPVRDEVELSTDVYGADAGGKRPVLLMRTPYNKNAVQATAERYAAAGYVVVVQDERGRYASPG